MRMCCGGKSLWQIDWKDQITVCTVSVSASATIRYDNETFNPLMDTGKYSATSNNMKLVHWPLIGGLLRLAQR